MKVCTIIINDDSIYEGRETFFVELIEPAYTLIGNTSKVAVTISDTEDGRVSSCFICFIPLVNLYTCIRFVEFKSWLKDKWYAICMCASVHACMCFIYYKVYIIYFVTVLGHLIDNDVCSNFCCVWFNRPLHYCIKPTEKLMFLYVCRTSDNVWEESLRSEWKFGSSVRQSH